jgi:WD40 repeat protein
MLAFKSIAARIIAYRRDRDDLSAIEQTKARRYKSIGFTADNRRVFTASTDGTARQWDVDINDTVRALCSRLKRDFTPEERAQYGIPDDRPTCPAQQ